MSDGVDAAAAERDASSASDPTTVSAAAPTRRASPLPMRRSSSNGSFVSARDSKFWLAVAVASKSSSASSSASSLSGSFLYSTAPLSGVGSSLDLLAGEDGENATERTVAVEKDDTKRDRDADNDLRLAIDIDDEVGEEGGEDEGDDPKNERRWKEGAVGGTRRVASITSPPPLASGLCRPVVLQKHRNRERLASDWRQSTSSTSSVSNLAIGGGVTTSASETNERSTVRPLPTVASPIKPLPITVIKDAHDVEVDAVMEEVYEHQRYQPVLGWGSKGHLMPMDPGKYVRIVRGEDLQRGTALRRPSLSYLYSAQALPSHTFPDVTLPETPSEESKWEWISPWHLEFPASASAVSSDEASMGEQQLDPDGWSYATSFSQFTSWRCESTGSTSNLSQDDAVCSSPMTNPRGRPKLNVRRRKWIRYRRLRSISSLLCTRELSSDQMSPSPFDDAFLDSMCGWLRKLGHVRKNWKLRYFVLEKSVLRYYTDEAMTRLKGEVLLFHPATRVHYVDIHLSNGRDNTFAIQVGPEYTLMLEADRVSDRENWMYCIEDALLCRDSYLQDPTRTQDVRESVARRRNFSSETILYSTNGETTRGINPINMLMLHSKTVIQATRKNPLMMRLMIECDLFLESKHIKQQISAFILKFKQKYGGSATSTPISKTMSPVALAHGNRRRTASYEGVDTRGSGVSVMQDPRSVIALKNYRFFLERAMGEVMDHLTSLPFANATCTVTSPRSDTFGTCSVPKHDFDVCESPPMSGEIDWELAKKAALYKLERQTFIPLQDIIYGLVETTVGSDDLDRFEWNRQYLAKQPQEFFEIQEAHVSPSNWKSARALLDSMDNYSLPTEKASILLEVAKCIYDTYATEHAVDVQMMAADDFLPIFIFILARCKLRNVVEVRHLISETMISCVMIGETGYYATMFEAAVSYIASFFASDDRGTRVSKLSK